MAVLEVAANLPEVGDRRHKTSRRKWQNLKSI